MLDLKALIRRIVADEAFRRAFITDPVAACRGFELSGPERRSVTRLAVALSGMPAATVDPSTYWM